MSTVNVKVAVRCRPMSKKEVDRGCKDIIRTDGPSMFLMPAEEGQTEKQFTFDHSYGSDATQRTLYEDLAVPILNKALEGYNGTIFAYGQTGSGKTHSMMGTPEDQGIVPLLARNLFREIEARTTESEKFMVTCSYLEIYNEVVHDLLNPSDRKLKIREHEKMGIYVEGLAELVVKSAEEVETYIEQGNGVRRVAETQMNARSSRSHSCFTLKVEQQITENIKDVERKTTLTAKVNLVDLAGSERASKTGATGDRLKEGAAINKSLSALGNVISVLAEGKKGVHIPYRNSKLTRLLQESLGGNALTVMIAAISPADYNHDETHSTLQYANRAKNIKNATHRNEDVNEKIIRELRTEIEELRAQLEKMKAQDAGGAGAQEDGKEPMTEEERAKMKKLEDMVSNLETAKHSTWEERERLSKLYEEERKKNLESEEKIRGVMQTVKEETLGILKKLKALKAEKTKLTKEFRAHKDRNAALKKELEHSLAEYERLTKEQEAGEDREEQLAGVLRGIEDKRVELLDVREQFSSVKERLKENEKQQEEWRAEAAAQRMVVEGDEELRKTIQNEERTKMEKEKEQYLEVALEEERTRLAQETAKEKSRLLEKYQKGLVATGKREQELEMQLLQERSDKNMLLLQLEDLKRKHGLELSRLKREHRAELALQRQRTSRLAEQLMEGFAEELREHELNHQQTQALLQQAVNDIRHLQREKEELARRLREEAAWEPPAG